MPRKPIRITHTSVIIPRPSKDVVRALNGKHLAGWKIVGRELTKNFYMKTFKAAISFIDGVARCAIRLDHYPDVILSEYGTVRLIIKTNEIGTVTMQDIAFARKVEALWKRKRRKNEKKSW